MPEKLSALSKKLVRFLSSPLCWRIVLGLFLVETLWLVFSAQYPMAFDENYHFGLIKLHATQWLPFFTAQPDSAGAFGAIARDPSYLYHWLLGFPYRFVSLFTDNQTAQIIFLRLINVAFFAYGLVLYRKVLRRLGASPALSNSLFLVLILIPVVPFLAAHINYDNLLVVVVPLTALLGLRLLDGFAKKRVDAAVLLTLLTVLFLSSLIKFPYLPVLVAAVAYLLWRLWRSGLLGRIGWRSFAASLQNLSRIKQIVLIAACLLSFGLFAERYAMNVVRYHDPVPACDAIISVEECLQYGPYHRDYGYEHSKPASFHPNAPWYVWEWFRGMWYRLFFAINYNYSNNPPLFVISRLAVVMAVLLVVGIAMQFRYLFRGNVARQLVLWLTVAYLAALFAEGFRSYARTGVAVAVNGRYLIPFFPFLFVFGGLAWAQLLRTRPAAKALAAGIVITVFLLQGGGTLTFIVRSDDTWIWNNGAVRAANRVVRDVVSPVIIGKGLQ